MTCAERSEQLLLFTAGLLEGVALDELDEHLETGCERCNRLLDELEAQSTDEGVPDLEHVRERLMARAEGDVSRPAASAPGWAAAPSRSGRGGGLGRAALVAAAIGGLALAGGTAWYARNVETERARLEGESAQLTEELGEVVAERDQLRAELEELETELSDFRDGFGRARREARLLRSEQLIVVRMTAAESQPDASARIFWHAKDYRCYLHALGLEPPAEGRRYMLWVVTGDDRKIAAGAFTPSFDGEATLFAALPRGITSIKRAVVTDEPEADTEDALLPDEPTGVEQLVWVEGDGVEEAEATAS